VQEPCSAARVWGQLAGGAWQAGRDAWGISPHAIDPPRARGQIVCLPRSPGRQAEPCCSGGHAQAWLACSSTSSSSGSSKSMVPHYRPLDPGLANAVDHASIWACAALEKRIGHAGTCRAVEPRCSLQSARWAAHCTADDRLSPTRPAPTSRSSCCGRTAANRLACCSPARSGCRIGATMQVASQHSAAAARTAGPWVPVYNHGARRASVTAMPPLARAAAPTAGPRSRRLRIVAAGGATAAKIAAVKAAAFASASAAAAAPAGWDVAKQALLTAAPTVVMGAAAGCCALAALVRSLHPAPHAAGGHTAASCWAPPCCQPPCLGERCRAVNRHASASPASHHSSSADPLARCSCSSRPAAASPTRSAGGCRGCCCPCPWSTERCWWRPGRQISCS
jgi:hypothetical protein